MNRSITIDHDGQKYTGHIATIKSTRLGYEDHGILTASLELSWEGSGVSFGGYGMDVPAEKGNYKAGRKGTAYGLDYVIRVLETVGVEKWEALIGKQLIILFDFSESGSTWGFTSKGIAGLQNDKVFIPATHAEAWRDVEVAR